MLWIVVVGFFAILTIISFNWTLSLEEDDYWLVKRRIVLGRDRAIDQVTSSVNRPDARS